jgi:Flp pilus assembly protein CpaB
MPQLQDAGVTAGPAGEARADFGKEAAKRLAVTQLLLGQTVGDKVLTGEPVRFERLTIGGADLHLNEVIDPGSRNLMDGIRDQTLIRRAAVTVRLPGVRIAPMSKITA